MATAGRIDIDINADADDAIRDLDRLGDEAERAGRRTRAGADQANRGANDMRRGFGGAGSAAANMGHQVQDMTVQLQAGTDWTIILAQQLPQMTVGLGAAAAAAGAAASIGFAALGVAMKTLGQDAKDLDDLLEMLDEEMSAVSATTKVLSLSARELSVEYGAAAGAVREYALLQSQLQVIAAESRLSDQILDIEDLTGKYYALSHSGRNWRNTLELIQSDFGATREQALELEIALEALGTAGSFEEQKDALDGVLNTLNRMEIPLESIPEEFREAVNSVIELHRAVAEAEVATDELTEAANAAFGAMADIEGMVTLVAGGMGALVTSATSFRDRLTEAASINFPVMSAIASTRGEVGRGGAGPGGPLVGDSAGLYEAQTGVFVSRPDTSSVAGSGGGGGSDDNAALQRELEALQESLMSKIELEKHTHEQRLQMLRQARENELLTNQEYNELERQITKEHNNELVALDVWKYGSLHDKAVAAFSDAAKLQNSGNKKLQKIGEAAAKAQIITEGYQAASSAWQKGMKAGGPLTAAAFAAVSVAKTASLLSKVGGGGFSDSGSSSSGSTATETAEESTVPVERSVTLIGDRFGRQQVSDLVEFMNEGTDNGYTLR